MARIPLPSVTSADPRRAHPFPLQIGYQTLEFLQGTLFYAAFADIAAGQQVQRPGGVDEVEKLMKDSGLESTTLDQGWNILQRYKTVFEGYRYQAGLIAMNSHWDWYIRRLAAFIRFSRSHLSLPPLSKDKESNLARADFLPMADQLCIIQVSTNVDLLLSDSDTAELSEMTLVRNIGLHNRWEIDEVYLRKTSRSGLSVGNLRFVTPDELQCWHSLLIKVINRSSAELAKVYCDVPVAEI